MKFLKDLYVGLTHNDNGSFSSTKFWQAIGYIVSSYIIIILTHADRMSAEYMLIYVGAAVSARSFQNYLVAKGGQHDLRDTSAGGARAHAGARGDGRGDSGGPTDEELLHLKRPVGEEDARGAKG